jgi:hypothetical protein
MPEIKIFAKKTKKREKEAKTFLKDQIFKGVGQTIEVPLLYFGT